MNDIKNTITKFAGTLTKSSSEIIKSTKLSVNLASEEENLKALYIEIGRKVHEIYMYGGTLGKFFDEKYTELLAQEEKIKNLKDQIDLIKGTKTCPTCLKSVEKSAEFCPKCGKKIIDNEKSDFNNLDERKRNEAEQKSNIVICKVCGKENDSTNKFCLSCARML